MAADSALNFGPCSDLHRSHTVKVTKRVDSDPIRKGFHLDPAISLNCRQSLLKAMQLKTEESLGPKDIGPD